MNNSTSSELEEGEASSFNKKKSKNKNNNNHIDDDDVTVDPDIALSYIDKKLEHVLGHFQKDFEGGFSAENLGAKFGGYGSFLPTYQRSPVGSHPKPPQKVQNSNLSRSPNNLLLEVGHAKPLPALKEHSTDGLVKKEARVRANEPGKKKACNNISDQKTLKFRIKVGTDNLSTQKNAAIYSGLGLDVSPSSSMEGSPSESDGIARNRQFESPFNIVQIMTSLPLQGLSPLPDFLIYFNGNKKVSSCNLMDVSDFRKGDEQRTRENSIKSVEKNDFKVESKSGTKFFSGVTLKYEDIDTLVCDELVSSTLKLPLLSNSCSVAGDSDSAKANGKTYNGEVYVPKEESVAPISFVESPKVGLSKAGENKKLSSSVKSKKEGHRKGEKSSDSTKDVSKQMINQNGDSLGQEGTHVPPAKKHSSFGGKKKSNGSHKNGSIPVDIPKETTRANYSSVPKNEKRVDLDYEMKKDQDEFKSEKDFAKSEDRYVEFFGDIDESEKEENLPSPLTAAAEIRLKDDSEMSGKGLPVVKNIALKEKPQSEKINKIALNVTYPGNEKNLCRAPAPATSKDNWVCCDKCQKWRLLPVGLNPEHLPEKWLCSMLYWLPGMNRCSFSEDETTIALTPSIQVHVQENQNALNGGSGGTTSGTNFHHPDRNSHGLSLPSMPKKKHGSKEISSAMHKDGPVKFSNSVDNVQSSSWGGNINGLSGSPLVGNPSNSGDLLLERHKHKLEEKKDVHNSDSVDAKCSNVKSKRDPEEDGFRASKKIKTKDSPFTGEDWTSDQGGAIKEKMGPSSSSGLPTTSKYNERTSSKDSKNDAKDKIHIPAKKLKDEAQVSLDEGSLSRGNYENRNLPKKRKSKESEDPLNYSEKEAFRDSVCRKEKKARVSKSEGKECSTIKGNNGKAEKKDGHSKDGLDYSKNGSNSVQPLVATTSSSSKVSGSHKSKAQYHESKSSPVESVCSSPLRIANSNPPHESSVLDVLGKDNGIKNKAQVLLTPDDNDQFTNGGENYLRKDSQHPGKLPTSDICHEEERKIGSIHQDSTPKKFSKSSSIRSKDKNRNFKSESDIGKIKNTSSGDKQPICGPSEARSRDGKNKLMEKFEVKSNEIDSRFNEKKDSAGKMSTESNQKRVQSSFGGPAISSLKIDGHDLMSTPKKKHQECNGERSSKIYLPEKTDPILGRENSVPLPPSRLQSETRAVSGPHKANGVDVLANNVCESNEASKMTKLLNKKADDQNGTHHTTSVRHTTPNTHNRIKNGDVQSPVRRDSTNLVANSVMKEATDLKHHADRFKSIGLIQESTSIYFQAVLKYLHASSLLESSCGEKAKQTYRSTAKLCEFCARDYEKSKDMASAALAYKCMEVAFMRVVYNSYSSANRDQQDLQTALQMVPSEDPPLTCDLQNFAIANVFKILCESPSSSASDVDNMNHPTAVDKTAVPKGVSSPQVTGHHVIAARNRPNLSEDVHCAMEASRKSRIAFAAANLNSGEANGVCAIKMALDFNFHDVLGLVRLVRLAMEVIPVDINSK
ncbi:hypothetical protein ACFE04_017988 [Oxalis oulophora]